MRLFVSVSFYSTVRRAMAWARTRLSLIMVIKPASCEVWVSRSAVGGNWWVGFLSVRLASQALCENVLVIGGVLAIVLARRLLQSRGRQRRPGPCTSTWRRCTAFDSAFAGPHPDRQPTPRTSRARRPDDHRGRDGSWIQASGRDEGGGRSTAGWRGEPEDESDQHRRRAQLLSSADVDPTTFASRSARHPLEPSFAMLMSIQ